MGDALFTGALVPTARYARFVWNGITLNIPDGWPQAVYDDVASSGANITASGLRESLWERTDQVCTLTLPAVKPSIHAQLRRFLREWALRGEQFEAYLDHTLRAQWMFEGEPSDNNGGNHFSTGEDLTYAPLTEGQGLVLPRAGALRAPLVSTLPGGAANALVSAAAGTLVLHIKPDWASNDGAEHVLLDLVDPANAWRNRLTIIKRGSDTSSGNDDNELIVSYAGANGAETAIAAAIPTWAADSEHTIMVQWAALTDVRVKVDGIEYATKKYPIVASGSLLAGSSVIAGTLGGTPDGDEQVMDGAPTSAALGSDWSGQRGRGTGVYGLLALYTVAYGLPDLLATYQQPLRTYYPRAELLDGTVRPVRIGSGLELYSYTLRLRDGR